MRLDDKIDSIAYRIAVENMNWEKGHREAAEWYLHQNNYENFTKEYQVIISQYPFKLSDYDYAASQLISVKQFDLAYTFLLKRFKESPDAFSTKWLGNINLRKGNVNEAISLSFDKTDPQIFYNLAGAYIQSKQIDKAIQSIDQCLKLKPDFPNAQILKTQLIELSQK